jgi:DNA helicase-2/ATP-dependent DNA helicase PcrA
MLPDTKSVDFVKAIDRLNPNQRLAVDTLEGPVMVIAGPGTGKTQVLTTRIANLIYSGTAAPQNILALTFTNAAAANMQERLVKMIGITGYQVKICTFHAFCSEVITENMSVFDLPSQSQPLSDLAKYEIFEKILTNTELVRLRSVGSKYHFIRDIISAVETLKREGVDEDEFEQIVKNERADLVRAEGELKKDDYKKQLKNVEKHEELITIYRAYQKSLKKRGDYDYNDMINLVTEAFKKDSELLLT